MTQHIRWEPGPALDSQRWHGKIGKVTAFIVKPHPRPWGNPDAWCLVTQLPGQGGTQGIQLESAEAGKSWAEDLLKDWLKDAGLQFKPAKKPRTTKPNSAKGAKSNG